MEKFLKWFDTWKYKRHFVQIVVFILILGCILSLILLLLIPNSGKRATLSNNRPAVENRKFVSPAIERVIIDVKKKLTDRILGDMFE